MEYTSEEIETDKAERAAYKEKRTVEKQTKDALEEIRRAKAVIARQEKLINELLAGKHADTVNEVIERTARLAKK